MRYVESSAALIRPDELRIDENCTIGSTNDQGCGGRAAEEKGVGIAHGDRDGATGDMTGSSSRRMARTDGGRSFLNIGFIGHDFDEHPTAHMVEGVFVWQRRLARTRRERDGLVIAPETGERRSPEDRLTNNLTTPMAAADCCR